MAAHVEGGVLGASLIAVVAFGRVSGVPGIHQFFLSVDRG
jgi:hypothetical protein